jgi:multicomponent Na+:H+ antiporter subunit D
LGVLPNLLYRVLPHPVDYHPYTAEHLAGSFEILLYTFLAFSLFLYKLHPENTISLDFDRLYKKLGNAFLWVANNPVARYEQTVTEAYQSVLIKPAKKFSVIAWNFDIWVVDGLVNASGWLTLLESRISEIFDIYIVDGTVNGVSTALDAGARTLRRMQTGAIQNYILATVLGIVVLAVIFMF